MAQKPTLGYWAIRGLAQPARFILAYAGVDYNDVVYQQGGAPDFDRSAWFDVKFTLGLPFPNLPYYMDGNVKLTGSNAIYRYLGRKYGLDGETEEEKANCDLVLEVTMDLRNAFVGLCYGPGFNDEKKAKYIEEQKKRLQTFADYLGSKKFFTGDKVLVCDFHMFEMLDQHLLFEPTILDDFPTLKAFWQRIKDIPSIKAYMESDKFKPRPVNNNSANWK